MAVIPPNVLTPVTIPAGNSATVVNAATATGTANSQIFNVQQKPDRGDLSVIFQAIKTAITVLTVDLEVSSDGGTTWGALTTFDFAASPIQMYTLLPGVVYRLNVKTITGTSVTINAAVN